MSSIRRRLALRFCAALTALGLIAVTVLGFSGAASAHTTHRHHSARKTVAKTQTHGNPLAALLANLTRTVGTTVTGLGVTVNNTTSLLGNTTTALGTTVNNTTSLLGKTGTALGTTVNNTTSLLGNTTTALGTTVQRTTKNLTTAVTGLLGVSGGGTSTPTPPPPTSPPPTSPSTPSNRPTTPTRPATTPAPQPGGPALGQAPSDDPSLVTSTQSVSSSPTPHHSAQGTEPTAVALLRSVSVLALVAMIGALAIGVGAIVFGAGRRGRRAS